MPTIARRSFLAGLASSLAATRLRGAPFVLPRDPQVVAFSPGGTFVATGCSGLSDGSFPPRPHPNVRRAAVVAVWDVATRKRLYRFETFGDFRQLAFSPTGRLLAACRLYRAADGVELDEVRVWDVTSGQFVQSLDRCHAFAFSPDGRQMAVLSRSRCVCYDVDDWRKVAEVKPLGKAITIAFAADGRSLLGIVRRDGGFCLRRSGYAEQPSVTESRALPQPFYSIAVSQGGASVATGHEGGNVVIWDANALEVRTRLQTGSRGIAHPFFAPDGQTLAAGCQETGDVVVWDLATRQEISRYTFEKGSLQTHYAREERETICPERDPTRFCFSPDGNAFLAGCYGGILRAARGGQELARFGE